MKLKNVFTVDVEDWYHAHDLDPHVSRRDGLEDRVEYGVEIILELLSRHNVRGTFFVLGCVARKHPGLVKRIAGAGHEIGSHGFDHKMIDRSAREDFRRDLSASKSMLEDLTGKEVKLYRAPSWSVTAETLWVLEVLEEEGFACDSSIYPFKSPLYGVSGAPVRPFHPVIGGRKLKLKEFPPTILKIGKLRVPFAGGLYLRALPAWFICRAMRKVNRQCPGMVYIHPWETDMGQPRVKAPLINRMAHYTNLETTAGKIEELLKRFDFVPLGDLISEGDFPALPVL
ncbi:MAG TPA: DUF3473 domain-containing protein [Bacillota bacterium]|nr:DUF3473 domain-containing protein [Bacillota bacterium]